MSPETSSNSANSAHAVEILAPVASWESLEAALEAGADAVYFGASHLDMRSLNARKLDITELPRVVNRCHGAGIRAYLTLNSVIYDNELSEIRDILARAKEAQVDAVIAHDLGVMELARSQGLAIHLSTQANVTNFAALRLFAEYADVVVLARELDLMQVQALNMRIREENLRGPSGKPVRTEVFAHGALCLSHAGKCYLSEHHHGKSANRGECYQDCRRNYRLQQADGSISLVVEEGRLLSAKDICTLPFLPEVLATGVSVLKIEGRGRPPEYVYSTVATYRRALNAIADGGFNQEWVAEAMRDLRAVFHRDFQDYGYHLGKSCKQISQQYGSAATHHKEHLGVCKGVRLDSGELDVQIQNGPLKPGDELLHISSRTGVHFFKVQGIGGKEIGIQSELVTVSTGAKEVIEGLKSGDKLYIWRPKQTALPA